METRRNVIGGVMATPFVLSAADAVAQSDPAAVNPPLSRAQAQRAAAWLKRNFGGAMTVATAGTPFSADLLCAMACQETAYTWLLWLDRDVATILRGCVLDPSGDQPGTSRGPFPSSGAVFRAEYGDEFADLLIAEGNFMRELRGWTPREWVYKGYGIFQYDLQYVRTDEAFFRERQWREFEPCLSKALSELRTKHVGSPDLWTTVRRYNGSGPRAVQYANNVMHFFLRICQETPAN
jgi:hypothetical protein